MSIHSLSFAATFANALCPKHHKLALPLPFRRLQILLVCAPPGFCMALLLSGVSLIEMLLLFGIKVRLKLCVPTRQRQNLCRRQSGFPNGNADLVAAAVTLLPNGNRAVSSQLLADRLVLMLTRKLLVNPFRYGGVIRLCVWKLHGALLAIDRSGSLLHLWMRCSAGCIPRDVGNPLCRADLPHAELRNAQQGGCGKSRPP